MRQRVFRATGAFLAVAAVLALLGAASSLFPLAGMREVAIPENGRWQLHFLDVGNADAILLRSAEHAVLVDAGKASDGERVAAYLARNGVDSLDRLIVTHPDTDHIGGAKAVTEAVPVTAITVNEAGLTAPEGEPLRQLAAASGIPVSAAAAGDVFSFGDATLTVLGPQKRYEQDNDNSLVMRFALGERAALLTGDAEIAAENDLLSGGALLEADVLKVSHHGSNTASGLAFLNTVKPAIAVISCGSDTPTHPATAVLDRLRDAEILRTDLLGTVILETDGTKSFYSVKH